MKSSLKEILTNKKLRELAGGRSFTRGEEYFKAEAVASLTERNDKISANVEGSDMYTVKLWVTSGELEYDCSCPYASDEGEFCKHCVAVGLSWLKKKPKGKSEGATIKDVGKYLQQQPVSSLVEMLMEQVMENDRLHERLLMKLARVNASGLDVKTFRKAIKKAVNSGGYVDYHKMRDYVSGIAEVLESVTDLLEEGFAAEVIQLAEYALEEIEIASTRVDDSNGALGGVQFDWQELHLDACLQAKPDPIQLARRLYEWEMKNEGELFYGAVDTYAEALGKAGIAEYRRLAEDAWQKLRPLKPGESKYTSGDNRFRLTNMMESLAKQSGNIEALVEIKKKDLSMAWDYLQIAEVYKSARKHKEALQWAEKGLEAFPEKTDSRLLDFLTDEYQHFKRPDDALKLIWQQFTENQSWAAYSLETYKKLKHHAEKAKCWPECREQALELIREQIDAKKTIKPGLYSYSFDKIDHSKLVEIFLWEKDYEAAWGEAHEGGCSNNYWLTLAQWREKKYPADAIPIYQSLAEVNINQKNNQGYEIGVQHIRKVGTLMQQIGWSERFSEYVENVRTVHKPKRNLLKLLDKL